jgi:hypothetical protein
MYVCHVVLEVAAPLLGALTRTEFSSENSPNQKSTWNQRKQQHQMHQQPMHLQWMYQWKNQQHRQKLLPKYLQRSQQRLPQKAGILLHSVLFLCRHKTPLEGAVFCCGPYLLNRLYPADISGTVSIHGTLTVIIELMY